MSRRNVRGLMFSLEDNDETLMTGADETAVDPEIIEEASAIESDGEAFDESADNLAALESIALAMEESLENDGLSEDAAKIADISIEHICNRLGMSNTKLMVATEQFGSSNTRLAATKISLEEGVWNTIKEGWNKMIEWIKAQCAKIADFFRKLVSGFSWQEQQIKKLDEKVNLLKSTKFAASFKDDGLSEKFRYASGGSTATGSDCINTIKNTINVVSSVSTTVKEFKADGKAIVFTRYSDTPLLGGQKFVVSKETGQMQFLSPPAGGGSSSECKTMSKDEMGQVLTECSSLLKDIQQMVTKDLDVRKFEGELISGIKKAMGEAKTAEDKSAQADKKKTITANANAIFAISGKIPKLSINTVSSALNYVSKSLSQYEKE